MKKDEPMEIFIPLKMMMMMMKKSIIQEKRTGIIITWNVSCVCVFVFV